MKSIVRKLVNQLSNKPSEEKNMNPNSAGADRIGKDESIKSDEVAGRALPTTTVTCPNCGSIRTIVLDPNHYQRFICPSCGNSGQGVA